MESRPLDFKRPSTVAQDVYRHLRAQLLSGALPAGQWLRELELARALDVSRTPIREAIRRLAQEGLLTIETNRGVRVHEPDLAEATATYEVREQLEGMAAKLAARHHERSVRLSLRAHIEAMLAVEADDFARHIESDNAFHLAVAELSGNPVLTELIERLNSRVNRVKVLTRHVNATEQAQAQHKKIVDAIVAGEADLAEASMAEHIRSNLGVVKERLATARNVPLAVSGLASEGPDQRPSTDRQSTP